MIERILVALDGSKRAPAVFAACAELAARFGARVYPLRVILVPPELPPPGAGMPVDPLPEALAEQARAELGRLTSERPDLRIEPPTIREGQAWRQILETAEAVDADLIVLGSHGYHGWDRILGTTAAKVANLACRNVLVVHGAPAVGGG